MKEIAPHTICSGCTACYALCPQKAISMSEDREGFLYPEINQKLCIDCQKCRTHCPVLHHPEKRTAIQALAAKSTAESIRIASSSGGIFSLLALYILQKKGVVYGAAFDKKFTLCHQSAENEESLAKLRGSKYLQSSMNNTFQEIKQLLSAGRLVLFSGTPCQVAGLHAFLGKPHPHLLSVDMICHGVPSPKVWSEYLQENVDLSEIKTINFRNKNSGWRNYHLLIQNEKNQDLLFENQRDSLFLKGFIRNLYLRPSCADCSFKKGNSASDITLGDFWGIENHHPQIDDNQGVSAILIYTEKGIELINQLPFNSLGTELPFILQGNPSLQRNSTPHPRRTYFFDQLEKRTIPVSQLIEQSIRPKWFTRFKNKAVRILKKIAKR